MYKVFKVEYSFQNVYGQHISLFICLYVCKEVDKGEESLSELFIVKFSGMNQHTY